MDIKEKLMSDARAKGICINGYKDMRSMSVASLVEYYTIHMDWCLERSFPSIDLLRSHFSNCENMGIYVDKIFNGELLNERQAYILHNCRGTIRVSLNVEKALIPMMYLANGCELTIEGIDEKRGIRQTIVPLYIFGENQIMCKQSGCVLFRRYEQEALSK